MLGKLGDLTNLMKKAKDMHKNLKKAQKEIAALEFTKEAGNGLVKVVISGDLNIKNIKIDPKCFEEGDASTVEDLVTAAVNSAIMEAKEESKNRLNEVTGGHGLDLHGLI